MNKMQFHLEKMVSEIQNYKDEKTFTDTELKEIIATRNRFEYRIQRASPLLIDFLRYIEYETALEQHKIQRKNNSNVITYRIIQLYKRALSKFDDPRLFVQFIEYLEDSGIKDKIREVVLEKSVKNLKDIDAAIYCGGKLFEHGFVEEARVVFQRSIRMNKNNELKKEYFNFEFLNFLETSKRNREVGIESEDEENVCFLVFKDIFDASPDCKEIDEIKETVGFTESLKNRIEEYCKKKE